MTNYDELLLYSDPARVAKNAAKYFDTYTPVYISYKSTKKYMIKKPDGKFVHFGEMGYSDYTKHLDKARRDRYLKRAMNISGNWYEDPYSANMLAINLLWM